jgi:hypothetical protein
VFERADSSTYNNEIHRSLKGDDHGARKRAQLGSSSTATLNVSESRAARR